MKVSDKVLSVTKCVVWLSRSECIYKNLSLEDWIFRNLDFTNFDGLLIWRNRPAIIVGRHQNCYTECDVEFAKNNNFDVARRNSGGGAVFHDLNNVNLSFFTSTKRHDRVKNLNLTKATLKKYWNVDVTVSKRHDLLLNNELKISGTAAKLAAKNSYHHFTLLLNTDERLMKSVLRSSFQAFEDSIFHQVHSKATQSVKAKVGFLGSVSSTIVYHDVVAAVVQEFLLNYKEHDVIDVQNPNNDNYIGLNAIEDEFKSWEWIFARNPPFSVSEFTNDKKILAKLDVDKDVVTDFTCDSYDRMNYWKQALTLGDRFDISICKRLFFGENGVNNLSQDVAKC